MYEIFKNISIVNDWIFQYARQDFQNLYDSDELTKVHLLVDPIKILTNFDDYGGAESTDYSGSFMLVKSSDIDEDYDTHYQNYIKPIINDSTDIIKNYVKCETNFTLVSWSTIEIINALDYNFSGVIVNYTISDNE
ncbi:hypothetical protein [Pseudotamlana agarivorans]|uniref:hypothetical protein n=1 Tax=Pseudotamlana agarivorans TaxID=481183 RepID=UPI000831A087|nr:hypothetical protein [Tamlana agarivorans]